MTKLAAAAAIALLALVGCGRNPDGNTCFAVTPGELADAYFGLLAELSRLLNRKVDLVTPKAIRNPYFLRAVNQTRRMLYAA